jgi:citrate synthase
MTYLVLTGRLPTGGQATVLNALFVAAVEHGISPPSMVSRCFASYGTSIQAAMAGGVLSFGDKMGGAGEQLAKLMVERVAASGINGATSDEALVLEARRLVEQSRNAGARLPGFGIPLHRRDPRSAALMKIARREEVFGVYCRFAEMLERELEKSVGKPIPLNLDGAGAALVLDLGFPWQLTRMFIITPRTVSMAAHFMEESEQDTQWRHVPQSEIRVVKKV